jgi:hypothetical protein
VSGGVCRRTKVVAPRVTNYHLRPEPPPRDVTAGLLEMNKSGLKTRGIFFLCFDAI